VVAIPRVLRAGAAARLQAAAVAVIDKYKPNQSIKEHEKVYYSVRSCGNSYGG
jgi:hypothetical protein